MITIISIVFIIIICLVISFIIIALNKKNTCRECHYKITDKSIKQCPKCGNPLK